MPMLNFRLLRPLLLLDINHQAELQQLQLLDDGTLRLGALLRHQQVLKAPQVQQHWPVMAAALAQIGHLAIRNRGTLGGSLSHADPAAEWPFLALLLQARVHLASAEGSRCLEAAEFITGAMSTALAPQELPLWQPRSSQAWLPAPGQKPLALPSRWTSRNLNRE
jgi:carbon-monoxide dehydrogenase medium subunit